MGQVESAGLTWTRSSRCDAGQCLEVAHTSGAIAVRDNTVPDVRLTVDAASWRSLLATARAGQLDR